MEQESKTIEFLSSIKVEKSLPKLSKEEITASLDKLKSIFPNWVNPDESPDLIFLASDLVVCDLMNANHVCLTREKAKEVCKGFVNKFVDIEHDRKRLIGFIISSVFTKVGTNEIIDEKDLDSYDGLVQISYAAIIWKLVAPKLCNFLLEASDPENSKYNTVSSSFELSVNDWDIAIGSKDVRSARIVSKGDKDFDLFAHYLPMNKGSGQTKEGDFVYRVLKGFVLATGAGLVANPASQVKGIYTLIGEEEITEMDASKKKETSANIIITDKITSSGITTDKIIEKDKEISENQKINTNISVNSNTTKSMKITKVEDIVASLFKEETTASAVTAFIAEKIATASEQYIKDLQAQKDTTKKLEDAKAAAETKNVELQAKVTELAKKLNDIEEQRASVEAEKLFNERMSAFDAEYHLDEDDRKSLATDVKACKTKEEFDIYAAKMKPLMKEKKKSFKKEKADKLKESVAACKGVKFDKIEIDPETLNFKEIVASVKETPQSNISTSPDVGNGPSLAEQMKAFKDNISFNGKVLK